MKLATLRQTSVFILGIHKIQFCVFNFIQYSLHHTISWNDMLGPREYGGWGDFICKYHLQTNRKHALRSENSTTATCNAQHQCLWIHALPPPCQCGSPLYYPPGKDFRFSFWEPPLWNVSSLIVKIIMLRSQNLPGYPTHNKKREKITMKSTSNSKAFMKET